MYTRHTSCVYNIYKVYNVYNVYKDIFEKIHITYLYIIVMITLSNNFHTNPLF